MDGSNIKVKPIKPLGSKAYGSIGHLPQSRVGPGDWHVHEGQARICLQKPRRGDRVIVCEKVDGACMSVARINGELIALSRAGYKAADALYPHLKMFDTYLQERLIEFEFLNDGERICGEWLALAHGTLYRPKSECFSPFVAFDIYRGKAKVLRDEFSERCKHLTTAAMIYDGPAGIGISEVMAAIGLGRHGNIDQTEGAVWRVEREGRVDFLAKYVRPEKIDGKYLPEISGGSPIWHWMPDKPKE